VFEPHPVVKLILDANNLAFAVGGLVLASAENKNKKRGSGTDPENRTRRGTRN